MQTRAEAAIWRRIYGKQPDETISERAERLAATEQQGAYFYLYLAKLLPQEAFCLRSLAMQKDHNARLLSALYFLETGNRLVPSSPLLPLHSAAAELLQQQYDLTQDLHREYQSETAVHADIFHTLAQSTQQQLDMMKEILIRRL